MKKKADLKAKKKDRVIKEKVMEEKMNKPL
jgi:hypothetical protein